MMLPCEVFDKYFNFFSDILENGDLSRLTSKIVRTELEEKFGVSLLARLVNYKSPFSKYFCSPQVLVNLKTAKK